MAEKTFPCRSFTRVRPFTTAETRTPPADCPIAREIIRWDGAETLTLLDHTNRFLPKKNGTYRVGQVLWSFEDDQVPEIRPASQKDVYAKAISPIISQIADGDSTAVLVAGGASSGRYHTMYGDAPDGPNSGLAWRFVDDLFAELYKRKKEESAISAALQVVDIAGDNYVDCLLPPKKKEVPLKLITSLNEGSQLQGVTTVTVSSADEVKAQLRRIYTAVEKRNTTHTISLAFTETFEFSDPDNNGQSVRKSRRFRVLLAMLRNMPAAFQRCVQVAVEHDSGENPMAKVPVRETPFTRLFPEVLQQGYALTVISCVSPFFEHVKEDISTLGFAVKVLQLVGKPKRQQDASLQEMRRLADEVKDLKTEVRQQNESMMIVQEELNNREVQLMMQEEAYQRSREDLTLAKEDLQLAIIGRNYQVDRSRRNRRRMQLELEEQKKAINRLQKEIEKQEDANASSLQVIREAEARVVTLDAQTAKEAENLAVYQSRMAAFDAEDKEIKAMEDFNFASPDEQERIMRAEGSNSPQDLKEIHHQEQLTAASSSRLDEVKAEYERALEDENKLHAEQAAKAKSAGKGNMAAADKKKKDCEAMEKQITQMNTEIADIDKQLKEGQSCCVVM